MEKKVYLKDIAYAKIKEKVLSGEFNETPYLSENELVLKLEMSRTPIRAALQKLETEGFLKIHPNQGISVTDLSIKDTVDLFEFRILIECFSLKKLIESANFETFYELLVKNIEEQRKAYSLNNPQHFMELDTEFHHILVDASDNSLFTQYMASTRERLYLNGLKIFLKSPHRIEESLQEHEELLEALSAKDINKSTMLLEKHLSKGRSSLLNY